MAGGLSLTKKDLITEKTIFGANKAVKGASEGRKRVSVGFQVLCEP
jgi:hypothetical protein